MRLFKPSLKIFLKTFIIISIVLIIFLTDFRVEIFEPSQNLPIIQNISTNGNDYINKYKIIDFDRNSLNNQNFSFLNNKSSSDFKFVLYYTSCAYGCWGNRKDRIVGNCFFTKSRKHLKVHEFDALLFHVGENWKPAKNWKVPELRSPHQKYIMYTHE